MFSTLQVAVAPARVANAKISRISRNTSTVSWAAATNTGLTYSVLVDGKPVCVTKANVCSIPKLLGPANQVKVVAVDASNVAAVPSVASMASRGLFTVGKVTFLKGRTTLSIAAKANLTSLASVLKSAGYKSVKVFGFSSESRSTAVAKRLSLARANAVASQLRKAAPWLRVSVVAKGANSLINANLTETQRQANRRATVVIQLG
jgi:outer membrane protein OmpA-like peptidoglycan-associated protein